MGLTLEFLAGDSQLMIAAFKEVDLDALYEPPACLYQADFSLHLIPRDLDLLSESLGELAGKPPLKLGEFLTGVVDGGDGGVLSVENQWIAYVAACSMSIAAPISKRWAEKMKKAHPDEEIELTEEMTEAVESLITLCQKAQANRLDVIHVWFG